MALLKIFTEERNTERIRRAKQKRFQILIFRSNTFPKTIDCFENFVYNFNLFCQSLYFLESMFI